MSSETQSDRAPTGLPAHTFASLLQAVTGLRNVRAVVAMLGCMFVGVIVAGLLLAMTGRLGFLAGLLASIVWIVAIGTGVNAAGLLQMDHARGISPRSTADALVYGLMCIPKLIVLGLAFFAVEVAVFIAVALLMLICKIPVLGPLLFVIVFPLSVVAVGVTIVGLFICMVLSLPAIWQGASITRALAQTLAIVRSRLVETVLLLVLLAFVCFAVGLIVFGVLAAGLVPTLGMSASIVGFGGFGMESLMAMSQAGGGSHAVAGAIGGALLWAVAASLVGQVYLLGLSLVYLRVTDGLDLTASEESLRAAFDDARRRTAELGEKARQATQRDASAPAPPATPAAPPATVAAAIAAPPAYSAPPVAAAAPAFDPTTSDPFGLRAAEQTTLPPSAIHTPHDADIALPFDAPAAPRVSTVASEWTPLPPQTQPPPTRPPGAAPLPAAAPLPPATTCPQCLSPVAVEDTFCGICGYRLK
ncbi:MAG TPA: zinc ribbon domain-containing protein [Caldimonas sp.]|nr:zinc ribbon domain-containing protein [Caldimonas sp.]HEX4232887.1 zinc ribbon domain-containing protein [Caldimonas sp.]